MDRGGWIPHSSVMWWITLGHIDRHTPTTPLQSVIYSKKGSTYWLYHIGDLPRWLYRQGGEIQRVFVEWRSFTAVQRCRETSKHLMMSHVADSCFFQLTFPPLCAFLTSECSLRLILPMCYVEPDLTFAVHAVQNHFIPFLWARLSQGLSVPMLESCAKAFCEWISYY